MGCQTEVTIGDNLTFTITTHDPGTAVLTDADFDPPYRVYEDETVVPILTGTMTLLDAVNTTGFYSELIACTAANGFENGRSYNIYIEATVGGDMGGISFGFRAMDLPTFATAIEYTYHVYESGGPPNIPIDGVTVDISTDVAGLNVVWSGETDTFGVLRDDFGNLPRLDAGTYYFWRQHSGFTFDNPDQEVVA
jgi:hypothetical protein